MSAVVIAVGGTVLAAGAAGYSAYASGQAANKQREQQLSAYGNLSPAPNYQDQYLKGWNLQNAITPYQVYQENKLRQQYAPQQAEQAYQLYSQYAPKIAQTNRKALAQSDPEFNQGYKDLYRNVSGELSAGRGLTPDQLQFAQSDIRGAQAARGNVLGNAPVSAEGLYTSAARDAQYQRRQVAMQNFLNGAGPESRYGSMLGQGAGFLNQSTAGLTAPGYEYYQSPQNFGGDFVQAAGGTWSGNHSNEMAQAGAAYGATAQQSPWSNAIAAGVGSLGGSMSGMGGMGGMMGGGGGSGLQASGFYGTQAQAQKAGGGAGASYYGGTGQPGANSGWYIG